MNARKLSVTAGAALLVALTAAPPRAAAQDPEVVAVVAGEAITRDDVHVAAADELARLERERLGFQATTRNREHEIVRNALNGIITDQVLDMEAEAQDLTVEELLRQEVESRVVEPSETEIQNVYQANLQQLINLPRAEGLARVRQFLVQQSYDAALVGYVEGLRESYGVEFRLDPYRVEVETAGFPSRGPEDAPIVMVEFSDFECPFCRQTLPVLEQVLDAYPDQIRFVYRQFPLTDIHPRAQKAAEASLCAGEQDAFWPMHDLLFADPIELEVASLRVKAETIGLDRAMFDACLDTGKYREQISSEIREGFGLGVNGTPTVFINGRPLTGSQTYDAYVAVIDEELAASN
jgi:protein-disulfide isomerase